MRDVESFFPEFSQKSRFHTFSHFFTVFHSFFTQKALHEFKNYFENHFKPDFD